MDFSKLSSSEKMAVYAAVAVVILAIYSLADRWGLLMWLPLIGGVGVLAVVLLPQMSPSTKLPGSRGSLLLVAGGGAAIFWALNTLVWLGYIFRSFDEVDTYIYLIGFAASLWLGWQSWVAFQAEGGKFVLGSGTATTNDQASEAPAAPSAGTASTDSGTSAAAPPAPPATPTPSQPAPPSQPVPPSQPMADDPQMGHSEDDHSA
ncbi:MAG TPA: hypothetical protein VK838_04425 [Candidatus Limnocylindrales bacterium]|nr:hypothetical protein [Candidatus Limnocylindrales bacterium]